MRTDEIRTGPATDGTQRLSLAGRLLLTTDGMVTRILEHILGEPIDTAGLVHQEITADVDTAPLGPAGNDTTLVYRRTRLVGARSGVVYVEAGTVVAVDALPSALRKDLMTTTVPIGRLLRHHRTECFREILSWQVAHGEPARVERAGPARIEAARRYLIFMCGQPAMLVSESFTADCFPQEKR